MVPVFVTGCCGFIGFHLTQGLLRKGFSVVGIDSLNSYYSPSLKRSRLDLISNVVLDHDQYFEFRQLDISDFIELDSLFSFYKPSIVVNLAAQAGVRYSLENPRSYIDSNIIGFFNILECSKKYSVSHLLYASSSSVYGSNKKQPFSESDKADSPLNIYAASKKSNELFAHSYSNLYDLRTTGLRFFTVYGPWGRPDMALYLFADAMAANKPIKVFNYGNMVRDFTYVDDIVQSILLLIQSKSPLSDNIPADVFNIGNSSPRSLLDYISELEIALNLKAEKILLPLQPGDVPETVSDCSSLTSFIGYSPSTPISVGIKSFVRWYTSYNSL